ncbi:MAG: response regulator, partial [Limnobacter sp.]|nr:response regulator [Limnobacter sp.]
MTNESKIPTSLLDVTNFRDEGLKVLFVEDNESDYELMVYRLKQSGLQCKTHRVDQYQDLRGALEHEEWHVVISDHRLPGFSSEEALQMVRDSGLGIPFIIVSGNIGEDVAVEAMRAGADDYLMKDNMARLAPAVERSLRAAQERRSLEAAERAQRESERRFAAIAENIPGIIFQMTSGGQRQSPRVAFVSEGVMRLFGVPPRHFLEHQSYFFEQFEPDDAADLNQAILEATEHNLHLTWEGKIKQRSSTEERWVLLNAVGKEQAIGVTWDGVLLDISDRKRAERDLRESKEELRRVAQEFEKRQEAERAAIAREIHDDVG